MHSVTYFLPSTFLESSCISLSVNALRSVTAEISWSAVLMLDTCTTVLNAVDISISRKTSWRLVVPMISSLRPWNYKHTLPWLWCYFCSLIEYQIRGWNMIEKIATVELRKFFWWSNSVLSLPSSLVQYILVWVSMDQVGQAGHGGS